jgi:geranylgeranyl pyrophosphate synthase
LAAQFSGASPHLITLYADMGKAIGTAGQLASDCHDLFQALHSKDLANGTRTFPIALYLEKKTPEEKKIFLHLLARAQKGDAVIEPIRDCLHRSGILRLSAFVVEIYCQRALTTLKRAAPHDMAARDLKNFIQHMSFFNGDNHSEITFQD